ncbi:MAG: hypothetical protein DWG76_05580 [Chloroflexi bacterium]|nr:TraM recognition domain-containing protein [Chloroflexota bacterium]MQC26900.1 hypothetical protein [Chloroflexota bacterium]
MTLTGWLMGNSESGFSATERATHTHVVGQSGTGKSRALESWVMQDAAAGRGVGVIDPHGDLFNNLLSRLAKQKSVRDRVVIFDPLDPDWVVGLNPLETIQGFSQERIALYLTDVVIKVWKLSPAEMPRMVWLLTNSFLALANLGLTLLDLPRLLVDGDFRAACTPRLTNEAVRRYFEFEYPHTTSGAHQWATPVLNKLGTLLFDPDVRQIFQGKATINFRQMMDEQKILLVNLPKGILGESLSSLLAAFVVAHLQQAALSRSNSTARPPFYLYLDEFQNYTTDNIQDILSESRKYALSLILAHQYMKQLPDQLASAVLDTAGTIVTFRVGFTDAVRLAKEIFPRPDFLQEPGLRLNLRSSLLPFSLTGRTSNERGWETLTRELASLQNRQFWSRKRGQHSPVKHQSFWIPDPHITSETIKQIQALRDYSGAQFARRKASALEKDSPVYQDDLPLWTA